MRQVHYKSVDELVAALKRIVNGQPSLQNIAVDGEVLKARVTTNGHLYFTLKDSEGGGEIGCVVWANTLRRLSYVPANGDRITVTGTVEIKYQSADLRLYATKMEPAGLALFYLQYQQLKAKLEREGLFDPAHKKQLPKYPMSIAVVTGDGTSGYQDVMHWLSQRWPVARVSAYPCMVQGNSAPVDIIRALKTADAGGHDLILLVRGGGGFMELFCFNDEQLARCIYDLNTPVVTGIGHEDDSTIADRVADRYSNVPSAAVIESTPDIKDVLEWLKTAQNTMLYTMNTALGNSRQRLSHAENLPLWNDPQKLLMPQKMRLQQLENSVMRTADTVLRNREKLNSLYQIFSGILQNTVRTWSRKTERCSAMLEASMQKAAETNTRAVETKQTELVESMQKALRTKQDNFVKYTALLDALSPLAVLARGYSVAMKDGHAIRRIHETETGDTVHVRLTDGILITELKGKENL